MTSWSQQKSPMPSSVDGSKYAQVDPPSVECAAAKLKVSRTFLPLCATEGSLTIELNAGGTPLSPDVLNTIAVPSACCGAPDGAGRARTLDAVLGDGGGPACTRRSLAGRPF